MKIPNYQDEVKHINGDITGTVIAKYVLGLTTYLDVRISEESVKYRTPAENWEVVRAAEELE